MSDALLGEWKLVSSENFDELMKKVGVGLMTRKIAGTTKPNVRFARNGDEWTFATISSLKSNQIKFKLNEEFNEETLDGRKVRTTMTRDGDKLVQTQKDKDGKLVCTITRDVTSNGELRVVRYYFASSSSNLTNTPIYYDHLINIYTN